MSVQRNNSYTASIKHLHVQKMRAAVWFSGTARVSKTMSSRVCPGGVHGLLASVPYTNVRRPKRPRRCPVFTVHFVNVISTDMECTGHRQ